MKNEYFDKRALKEIAACEWASELIYNPSDNITITRLGDNINSPYSDFGASEEDDEFYFTSRDLKGKKICNIQTELYLKY
ncbi:MAG: hypothetical protein R2771_10635 [Saprospiraceae bacterium]